ncbi:MAG TPA: hypothetical protein DEB39_06245 [Planctomycetaceae bacterium]|nr:hypothetical protein [Planctomycetaceae bacterium]
MDFVQAVKEGVKPSAPPASSPDPFAAVPVAPTMPGPPAVPPVSSGSAEFWKFMREHFVAIIIFVLISPCLLSCMCSMCIPSSYRDGGGSAYSPGGSRVEQERNRQAALEKARKAFGELLVSGKKFVSDWSYNGQFGKIGFVIEEHSPEMHTFKGFVFDVTEPAKKKLMDGKFDVSLQAKYPVVLSCSRIGVPKTEWTNRTQSFFLLDDYNTKFELQLDGNTLAGVADGYDAHRAAMRFTEISDEAYENIMSTFENAEKVRIAKINDAIAPGKNYTCDWNYDGNIGKLGIRIESLDTGAGTFEGYLYNVRAPAEKKRFTGVVNYSRAAGAQYVFRESQIGISRPNYMTNPTGYFFLADGFASTFSLTLEAGELVGTVAQRNSDRFGPDCRFKETN